MTFDRIQIFLHKKAQKWLKTADYELVSGVEPELYVGVTRVLYSVTCVYDETSALKEVAIHQVILRYSKRSFQLTYSISW
jgi:DNA helicase II / ATP-dependent DNA helicase PcrA